MFAPVGKRWTLATICWWGGWAQGEHVSSGLVRYSYDGWNVLSAWHIICYLLNELSYYEEGHGDALHPIQRGADISLMGEHLETQPATLGQVKALCASVKHTIHDQLNHQQSQPLGIDRHGEHQPSAMTSLHPRLPTPTPTSLPQPLPNLSPPPNLQIPWTWKDVPIHECWLVFVKDWEEGDKERGLTMPLKDWNPAWKATLTFAMNCHARKIIALEFIERYESTL